MLSLPKELIVYISQFVNVIHISQKSIDDSYDYNYGKDYPMWNLYATCKSFQWMLDLECLKLCYDESIVTLNINNIYQGPHYDIMFKDIDYYDKGEVIYTEKFDVNKIKECPIIKFLIDKNDYDYVYLNYKC